MPISSREPSLRRALSIAMVLVAVLALAGTGSLVALTTVLHRSGETLSEAIESVHLAEGAEVDLLVMARAGDPVVRTQLAADIRRKLARARARVTSAEQVRALDRVDQAVGAYLAASRAAGADAALDVAYAELEDLVQANLEEADATRERAARWSQAGKTLGISIGVLIMLTATLAIWWLRTRTLRPVLALASAMDRFGRGEPDTRAPADGAAELRMVATHFNEMADALSRQRDAQATFLASVAHDLRNPLSALRVTTELVQPDRPLPDEAQLRKMFLRVQRQVSRLDRMAGDFEDRARIESGELRLEPHRHDAREVAQAVADLFEGVSPAHPIELACPSRPIWVDCDAVRMEQVLTNLVSNAIKYSPSGGRIDIEVAPVDGECVLAVSDHGVGLGREEVARLFEPYQRGTRLRDEVPGAGLGLASVRRIVEAHHGRIEVSSQPGQGTRFEVHLPVEA